MVEYVVVVVVVVVVVAAAVVARVPTIVTIRILGLGYSAVG